MHAEDARPKRRPCAKTILSALARRAYRRPATGDEIQTLLDFYRTRGEAAERGFEAGIQSALERMLVSFNFLFRIESDPPGAARGRVYRLSDVDLASRLSFFLWSSIPDEELLKLAERGRLKDPAVLEQQVRAHAARPAMRRRWSTASAASGSASARRTSFLPDPEHLPGVRREPARRVPAGDGALPREPAARAIAALSICISADYSFVNERLAQHYGVPNVYGERFRKVTFTDGTRGGLLGQGSILMVTSYPDRTAPVLRGFWMLENLLGMPPPPPPPDMPDLETDSRRWPRAVDSRADGSASQEPGVRRRATCAWIRSASRWRISTRSAAGARRSDGLPVDASAVFADGTPIDGVQGLRAFLVKHRDNYVHTFVEKLLTYALGRHVDYRDQPAIRAIVRDAAAADYRWSAIILGIVQKHAVPDEENRVMMITKKALSRRTVLKALGAAVPLPLLDAMVPALTALRQTAATPALRFGAVYVPNGVIPGKWFPTAEGAGLRVLADAATARGVPRSPAGDQRPRQRAAAAARRAAVQQSRGREHAVPDRRHAEPQPARRRVDRSDRGEGARPGHVAAVARARAGIGGFGNVVRLRPQLRLHRAPSRGPVRRRRCRWSTIPSAAFVRLFGDGASSDASARGARACSTRAASSIRCSAKCRGLRQQGRRARSHADRPAISKACATSSAASRRPWRTTPRCRRSIGRPAFPRRSSSTRRLMFDLQLLAYQGDVTRVVTFMLGREFSGRTYPEIGVPDAHHPISHHQRDPVRMEKCAKINHYHVSLFS